MEYAWWYSHNNTYQNFPHRVVQVDQAWQHECWPHEGQVCLPPSSLGWAGHRLAHLRCTSLVQAWRTWKHARSQPGNILKDRNSLFITNHSTVFIFSILNIYFKWLGGETFGEDVQSILFLQSTALTHILLASFLCLLCQCISCADPEFCQRRSNFEGFFFFFFFFVCLFNSWWGEKRSK